MNFYKKEEKTLLVTDYVPIDTGEVIDSGQEYETPTHEACTTHTNMQVNEEEWTVKALGFHTFASPLTSNVEAQLSEIKRKRFDQIIELMRADMVKVTFKTEETIKKKSKVINDFLVDTCEQIKVVLSNVRLSTYQLSTLDRGIFANVTESIWILNEERLTKIEDFYRQLLSLEKQRCEKFKQILKEAYNKNFKTNNKLPCEIQTYFEQEIMQLNQVTLNNHHCYSQLKERLKLKVANDMKGWMEEIENLKHEWRKFFTSLALQKVNDIRNIAIESNEKLRKDSDESISALKLVQSRKMSRGPMIRQTEVDDWWVNVANALELLTMKAKDVITLYKEAIIGVFNRVFDTMKTVTQDMIDSGIAAKTDIDYIHKEIYKPALQDISHDFVDDMYELQLQWKKTIESMEAHINETYNFFCNASSLWIDHDNRINEAKNLIKIELKNAMTENDKASAKKIRQFILTTDKVRIAQSEKDLEKNLADIRKMLGNLLKFFKDNNTKESLVLNKILKLADAELMAQEIEHFLSTTQSSVNTQSKEHRTSTAALEAYPSEIELSKCQIKAIKNWMLGLWQSIYYYSKSCKAEQYQEINKWIECKKRMLEERANFKCVFTSVKYQRIKEELYDIRLSELRYHADRMDMHKIGITQEIQLAKEELVELKANCEHSIHQSLETLKSQVDTIRDRGSIANANQNIPIYIAKMESCTKDIQAMFQQFNSLCKQKIRRLKLSNMKFIKSMLMFSEDGNFSALECKTYSKEILLLNKLIIKLFKPITREAETFQVKMKQLVEKETGECIDQVNKYREEFEFMDKITKETEDLQNSLKSETTAAVYAGKKRESYIKCFKDMVELHFNRPTLLSMISSKIQVISDLFEENVSYFGHSLHNRPLVYQENDTLIDSDKAEAQNVDLIQEYFTTPKLNKKEQYIAKTYRLIDKSYQGLDADARKFYSTPRNLLLAESGKIHETYEAFLNELTPTYERYRKECEANWQHCIVECMVDIKEFSEYLFDKILKWMSVIEKRLQGGFKDQTNDGINSTKVSQKSVEEAFMNVLRKLKPLHGHPRNRKLLQDLEEELQKTAEDTKDNTSKLVEAASQNLSQLFSAIEEYITQIDALLNDIGGSYKLNEFFDIMKQEYVQTVETLDSHKDTEKQEVTVGDSKEKDEKQAEFLSILECDIGETFDVMNLVEKCKQKLQLIVSNLSTELEDSVKVMNLKREENEKVPDRFKLLWEANVNRILDLYKVKYTLPCKQ